MGATKHVARAFLAFLGVNTAFGCGGVNHRGTFPIGNYCAEAPCAHLAVETNRCWSPWFTVQPAEPAPELRPDTFGSITVRIVLNEESVVLESNGEPPAISARCAAGADEVLDGPHAIEEPSRSLGESGWEEVLVTIDCDIEAPERVELLIRGEPYETAVCGESDPPGRGCLFSLPFSGAPQTFCQDPAELPIL